MAGNGRNLGSLFAFVALGLTVYSPLSGVGFVTDFLGWLQCYQSSRFWDYYQCFGAAGLFYVPYTLLFLLTSTFGLLALPWHLFFTLMHCVNAWLVVHLFNQLLHILKLQLPSQFAWLAGLVFLLHPYQVEVLAWKACVNYLSAGMLICLVLMQYLKFLETNNFRSLVALYVLFAISLFNIEYTYVVPLVASCILFTLPKYRRSNTYLATGGLFALVGLVLLTNQLVLGDIIGHYGLDISGLDITQMASAFPKYTVKLALFARFWPYHIQNTLYDILSYPFTVAFLVMVVVALLGQLWFRRKELSSQDRLMLLLVACFTLFILPVSHLYFYYLQYSENDRYTYLAMIFFAMLVPMILNLIPQFSWRLSVIFLLACLVGNGFLTRKWQRANEVSNHLLNTYRWESKDLVLALNVPDNLQGIYLFRNVGGASALSEPLSLLSGKTPGEIVDVLHYNMARSTDGVTASWVDRNTIRVEFNQWGNWWWESAKANNRFYGDGYELHVHGKHYDLHLKEMPTEPMFIYFDGLEWRELARN